MRESTPGGVPFEAGSLYAAPNVGYRAHSHPHHTGAEMEAGRGFLTLCEVSLEMLGKTGPIPKSDAHPLSLEALFLSFQAGPSPGNPTCGSVVAHTSLKIANRRPGLPLGEWRKAQGLALPHR